jgi:NADH-quinone oxidoreductase subunit G
MLNSFVVSLEISHSAVTAIADVVLPVAAVVEKAGSFLDWSGKPRSFDKAVEDAQSRSDLRILSMLADELGSPIGLDSIAATAREIASLGKWDGADTSFSAVSAKPAPTELTVVSWRLLLDLGSLQTGETNLAGTAHKAAAHISTSHASKLGVSDGDSVKISSGLGSLTLPVVVDQIADNLVWVPRNSEGSQVIANLGFASGSVTVTKA